MTDIIDKAKKLVQDNSTKLSLAVAGAASLGCIYFAGKAKGETTLYIDIEARDTDNDHQSYTLRNR